MCTRKYAAFYWGFRRRALETLGLLLLVCTPLYAQSHADLVAAVKADLQAKHIDLAGPCGGFAITRRVAWQLRAEGAGVLDKPAGNQCDSRAVDIIIYPDGKSFDILTDAGGSNGPAWNLIAPIEASRWRAPSDPGDAPSPPPTPIPTPPPVPVPVFDPSPLLHRLEAIEAALLELDARERADVDANQKEHRQDNATFLHTVERLDTTLQAIRCEAKADLGFARIPIRCEVKH